jgi:hypothetical protein
MSWLGGYLLCKPKVPDAKCNNCKRLSDSHINSVNVRNSKDKACIYIPISLQEEA